MNSYSAPLILGVARVASDGSIVDVSPGLLGLLGYDSVGAIAAAARAGTLWIDATSSLAALPSSAPIDAEWCRKDGRRLRVRLSGERTADGGVFVVIEDLDRRHLLTEQACQLRKLAAVGRLAGGVAHNFNNLLTAVQGFAQILGERHGEDPDDAEALNEINSAARRASTLVRQLLTFSGRRKTSAERADANHVCQAVCQLMSGLVRDHVKLTFSPAAREVAIRIDSSELEQALIHLLLNAQDALPEAGEIHVDLGVVPAPPAGISGVPLSSPGPWLSLTVRDNGRGMTQSACELAFEPFFSTNYPEQLGLGLSVVHGLVRQNAGAITVESELDRGTTVRLFFPLLEPVRSFEKDSRPLTVLLVDDDAAVLDVATRSLQRGGIQVIACDRPEAALKHLDGGVEIDALVTDVAMPEHSGRWLADQVRRRFPSLGVLFLSGYTEGVVIGDMPPRTSVLAKPFAPMVLTQAVRDLVASRSATECVDG